MPEDPSTSRGSLPGLSRPSTPAAGVGPRSGSRGAGLKIVELFAGLCGWTSAADLERDVVVTTDIEARFETTITADVLEPDLGARLLDALGDRPDVVLASPPCEAFSVLQIGRNWTGPDDDPPHMPKTDRARFALRLVERTRELLDELGAPYFVVENPRAKLRKLPVVGDLERRTVTYCQLGEPFMKPTDLWGGFPPSLVLPAPCRNGAPCHIRAGRGSTTGIQGTGVIAAMAELRTTIRERHGLGHLTKIEREVLERLDELDAHQDAKLFGTWDKVTIAALRAKVPLELSRLVLEAARRDLVAGRESVIAGQSALF